MSMPTNEKTMYDLMNYLIEGSKVPQPVEDIDGKISYQPIIDNKIIYWGTQSIAANTFGRFVWKLEEFLSLATDCYNFMSEEKANILHVQIKNMYQNYRYSIDAKNSESIKDKNNSNMTKIDKLGRNKQERVFTVDEKMKHSLMDGIIGRQAEKDAD
jgi:hypothetical protein